MSDNYGLPNPELGNIALHALNGYVHQVKLAEDEKRGFVDPATMQGGGMPPGGDPMAGGMPPGGMPPGGDPMMGGMPPGGAPMDPAMMGGMPPPPPPMPPAAPPAAAPGAEGIKPKIDVNVELMQIKNMLAKIVDGLGIQMPAQDMTATPEKLNAMAAGGDPSSGGGAAAGGEPSAIQPPQPIEPMGAATPAGPEKMGMVHDRTGFNSIDTAGLGQTSTKASAIMMFRNSSRNGNGAA
jgi:hypothetical protein